METSLCHLLTAPGGTILSSPAGWSHQRQRLLPAATLSRIPGVPQIATDWSALSSPTVLTTSACLSVPYSLSHCHLWNAPGGDEKGRDVLCGKVKLIRKK